MHQPEVSTTLCIFGPAFHEPTPLMAYFVWLQPLLLYWPKQILDDAQALGHACCLYQDYEGSQYYKHAPGTAP